MNYFALLMLLIIGFNAVAQQPGSLNAAFSLNGWDTVYGNNNGFELTGIVQQPDKKILVCAEASFSNEGHQAVLVRYNPDGTYDAAFGGGDGVVRSKEDAGINLYTRAYGIALQSTGKIIVAGDQFYNSERIFRLHADGTLDATFGIDGVVDMNRPNSEFIYHVAVQSDDKIIVCGKESLFVSGVLEPHVFLWRFTADGALDMSFGNSGVVSYNSQAWLGTFETYLVINDLIVLPNDDIIVNQSFTNYPNSFVMLSKMKADGAFDASFGIAGHSTRSVKSNDGVYTYSSSAVQQNGSILSLFTTRDTINATYSESVYRLNTLGQIDPSLNVSIGMADFFPVKTRLMVSGNYFYHSSKSDNQTGNSYNVLRCYTLSGSPVADFGNAGMAVINQNNIPVSATSAAAVADNGDIIISSGTPDPDNSENLLFLTAHVIGAINNVSIGDAFEEKDLSVYPNPTSGLINFKEYQNSSSPVKVEVRNGLGQIVFAKTDFTMNDEIDISNQAQGIYFLKIKDSSKEQSFKVLKQ